MTAKIKGFNGKYLISDTGEVLMAYRNNANNEIVIYNPPIIRKAQINACGYLTVQLLLPDKRHKLCGVHRLVAEYFIPNPKNYKYVAHKNGNKLDNSKDNLFWTNKKIN